MKRLFIISSIGILLGGCHLFYPSQMLRPGRGYQYAKFTPNIKHDEYRIAPYDLLSFSVYTNNGEKLLTGGGISGQSIGGGTASTAVGVQGLTGGITGVPNSGYTATVERDGKIKFPIFGRIEVAGMTLKEVENMLETRLSVYFREPFVQLKVSNKRVFVITSSGVNSKVVTLINDNESIFEVLAESGGVPNARAYRIKLIRGDLRNPEVYLLDLSTIKGVVSGDMVMQSGDIIYIENTLHLDEKIFGRIEEWTTIISTATLLYVLFSKK